MGNTATGRRNSMLPKQESSSSEGQGGVKLGRNSRQNTLQEEEEENQAVDPEPLTDRQKELLVATWKVVEGDIAKVGVITFIRWELGSGREILIDNKEGPGQP